MITERDLDEAIAECQGVRNPNADTCVKLASFYVIKDHMRKEEQPVPNSYSMTPAVNHVEETVNIPSKSEFASRVNGLDSNEVMAVMDELMSALEVMNPRLYKSVMNRF